MATNKLFAIYLWKQMRKLFCFREFVSSVRHTLYPEDNGHVSYFVSDELARWLTYRLIEAE